MPKSDSGAMGILTPTFSRETFVPQGSSYVVFSSCTSRCLAMSILAVTCLLARQHVYKATLDAFNDVVATVETG